MAACFYPSAPTGYSGDVLLTMTDDGVGMPEQVRRMRWRNPLGPSGSRSSDM